MGIFASDSNIQMMGLVIVSAILNECRLKCTVFFQTAVGRGAVWKNAVRQRRSLEECGTMAETMINAHNFASFNT